ncbi:hypothetical protein [Micromonospora craniellae]|uniref:DUF2637 domain-containing protein n=2 Tax=Micromonospora craniellae TaxID=2294034 RepID=A0A372FQ91_9ACTN|nr:hypothetical protein [Micromonospora craniellae]RFS38999.1 hypothetical protein D0Q02_31040 [Micromonospora craniellae]
MTRDALDADLIRAVRHAAWTRQTFYVLVLLVALVGQVTGAVHTLDVPLIVAAPAVAALELGGVVVMANADVRRRLGEQAIASRLLSAAIAAGAVAFNWAAHPDHLVGGFFSGMSALGYLVWMMHTGNQRRDRLRLTGELPPTPPTYEVLGHWIRHPIITSRARSIAKADSLDLYESLKAAHAATARQRRDAAIAKVLHRKIKTAVDPTTADIAVQVYDLDEIAARLAASADYNGLTTLLAADLAPERIITAHSSSRRRRFRRDGSADPPPVPESTPSAADAPGTGQQKPQPAPNDVAHVPPLEGPVVADSAGESENDTNAAGDGDNDEMNDDQDAVGGEVDDDRDSEAPKGTAEAVAYWLRKEPNLDPELLAERIGKSLRSIYRHLPQDYPRRPGIARARTRRQPTGRSK